MEGMDSLEDPNRDYARPGKEKAKGIKKRKEKKDRIGTRPHHT
jgi:hypothetical protein